MKKVYFIGLNHSFIVDLAIALKEKGYRHIEGSDEAFSEENQQRLGEADIVFHPSWNPQHISTEIDYVVIAPQIKLDNSEMQQAQSLNLQIMTIPEFIYDRTKNKTRLVVAGTLGKKSLLAIIINVLKRHKLAFDYVLSSPVSGVNNRVHLEYNSRMAIIEGDELISSPIKKKFKLEFYRPHIALFSNIIWEEPCNDFSSKEAYAQIFKDLTLSIERDGKFIYKQEDEQLEQFAAGIREDITAIPYTQHPIVEENEGIYLDTRFGKFLITSKDPYFLENLSGARNACRQLGVSDKDFYSVIHEVSQQLKP